MAPKPADLPRWADLANPLDVVDPPSGKKDSGWLISEVPPHTYFNWLLNKIYEWTVYLDTIEVENHSWSGANDFTNPAVFTGDGSDGAVMAYAGPTAGAHGVYGESTNANHAIHGITSFATGSAVYGSSSGASGVGVQGVAAGASAVGGSFSGGAFGVEGFTTITGGTGVRGNSASVSGGGAGVWGRSLHHTAPGVYGSGAVSDTTGQNGAYGGSFVGGEAVNGFTGTGGVGATFQGGGAPYDVGQDGGGGFTATGGTAGGSGAGAASAGFGGTINGGEVDGGQNISGAAGVGLFVNGGTIVADANGRTGGAAIVATGGMGQAGRGRSFNGFGDMGVDGGVILTDFGGLRNNPTLAQPNVLTKKNINQVTARCGWALGVSTFDSGHQVASISIPSVGVVRVNVAGAPNFMGNFIATATVEGYQAVAMVTSYGVGYVDFALFDAAGATVNTTATTGKLHVMIAFDI